MIGQLFLNDFDGLLGHICLRINFVDDFIVVLLVGTRKIARGCPIDHLCHFLILHKLLISLSDTKYIYKNLFILI